MQLPELSRCLCCLRPPPHTPSLQAQLVSCGFCDLSSSSSNRSAWLFGNATIANTPAKLCFDTGATTSTLDSAFCKQLMLTSEKGRGTITSDIHVGTVKFRGMPFDVGKCQGFLETGSGITGAVGIVGMDSLISRRILIDFGTATVYCNKYHGLFGTFSRVGWQHTCIYKLRSLGLEKLDHQEGLDSRRWYVKLNVNGQDCLFLIDSGAGCNALFARTALMLGEAPPSNPSRWRDCMGRRRCIRLYARR